MKRILFGMAAAMAAAACGGSASPGTSVNGSTHGQAVQTQNGVSAPVMISEGGVTGNFADIILTNDGNLCSDLSANKQPKNAQVVALLLWDRNSNGTSSVPVGAGDYQVYAGTGSQTTAKYASVIYVQTDGTCHVQAALSAQGMSGVVHLTGVNNGVFSGTFDIVVAENDANGQATSTTDHWTGTFNPSLCAGLSTATSSGNTNPTCY